MTSLDLIRGDARALQRRLDGDGAELRGRQLGQGALEGPDGSTRRAHDDDFTSHGTASLEMLEMTSNNPREGPYHCRLCEGQASLPARGPERPLSREMGFWLRGLLGIDS